MTTPQHAVANRQTAIMLTMHQQSPGTDNHPSLTDGFSERTSTHEGHEQ